MGMAPRMPGYGLGSSQQTSELVGNSGDLMEKIGSTVDATKNIINARALKEITGALGISTDGQKSSDVTAELLGAVTGAFKGTSDLQMALIEKALKGNGNGNSDGNLMLLVLLSMMNQNKSEKSDNQSEIKIVMEAMKGMYETIIKSKDELHERERSRLERSSGMGPTEAFLQNEIYPNLIQMAAGKLFQSPTDHLKELASNAQEFQGLLKNFGGGTGDHMTHQERLEVRRLDLEEYKLRKEAEREAKKPTTLDTMNGLASLVANGAPALNQLVDRFIGGKGFAPVDFATPQDQAAAAAVYNQALAAQGGGQ
jgi:hypothetical protein